MKKLFFIIGIISTISIYSQNQNIYSEEKNLSFSIKYSSDQTSTFKNQILNKIAVNIPKSVYNTQFNISFKCKKNLYKNGNQLNFIVELSDFQFSGDCMYKGFPLGDALIPEKAGAKINLITNINQIVETFEFDNLNIIPEQPANFINYMYTDTFNFMRYKFDVSDFQFLYTQNNVNIVNEKCFIIDDLYNTDTQMQIAYAELQTIDLNNLDMLFEYKKITDKNANLLKIISDKNFPEKLGLKYFDPINFEQKYSDLYMTNSKIAFEIDNTIKNLYQIYYTKGLEFLANGDITNAELYFNKSINANLMFAPAHFQIAKILYNKQLYDESLERIKDILYKMQPEPNTHNLTVDLANQIYNDYINFASNYNAKKDYTQAIENLQKAESVCNSISGVLCDQKLNGEYSTSYQGQLSEYCDKAQKSITNKDFENAESLIATAFMLVNNKSKYIKDKAILNQTVTSLFNAYINDGFNKLTKKFYSEALNSFEAANILCQKHEFIECNEELAKGIYQAKYGIYSDKLQEANNTISIDPYKAESLYEQAVKYRTVQMLEKSSDEDIVLKKIKTEIYKTLISKGKNLAVSKLYDQALNAYNEAKNIEITYLITPDLNLENYIKNSARALFFLNINNGKEKVNENDLKSAREFYKKAEDLTMSYPISKDADVIKAISELKEKIFSQECKNAQAEYDKFIDKAIEFIKNWDMISADKMLDKSIEIAKNNIDCGIETTSATNKKQEIMAGVIYQKKLSEIKQLEQYGEYQKVIDEYIDAEKYYNGNNVADLKLTHILLFDYILNSDNQRFLLYASRYYLDNNDFDKSLKILHKLRKTNYKASYTKDLQILLGTKLAIEDHKKEPDGIAKNLIIQYTGNDKWYKYLRKAYIKQFKRF